MRVTEDTRSAPIFLASLKPSESIFGSSAMRALCLLRDFSAAIVRVTEGLPVKLFD